MVPDYQKADGRIGGDHARRGAESGGMSVSGGKPTDHSDQLAVRRAGELGEELLPSPFPVDWRRLDAIVDDRASPSRHGVTEALPSVAGDEHEVVNAPEQQPIATRTSGSGFRM